MAVDAYASVIFFVVARGTVVSCCNVLEFGTKRYYYEFLV
jgi:hypothetical protein